MASGTYDIITVGGGLGGSTLAKAMAEHGARVLVLERETHFKDRVRGENIWSWGVAELKELGVYELLRHTCAREILWFDIYLGIVRAEHRDVLGSARQHLPALNFYHPAMQEILLQAAAEAGAEIRRGARAGNVKLGATPTVTVEQEGRVEELKARLIVCADGRGSVARKWAGFPVHQDLNGMFVAGVLFEQMAAPQVETNYWIVNPPIGQAVFLAPLGQSRVRAYVISPKGSGYRLQGANDVPRFIEESVKAAAPAEWYTEV